VIVRSEGSYLRIPDLKRKNGLRIISKEAVVGIGSKEGGKTILKAD
jgi:hypothetical protein